MAEINLEKLFKKTVGLEPTKGQGSFFRFFESFIISKKPKCTLLLKGYAGTGKTTLISVVVKYLDAENIGYVLLAPTGRAAKVMANYSQRQAFTIHKMIYQRKADSEGKMKLELKKNFFRNTVFIVDEASMIQAESSDSGFTVNHSVLEDLLEFIFSGENCRVLFAGDVAQLPPVGSEKSLALDAGWLKKEYNLTTGSVELTEVVRQESMSGILANASLLRTYIDEDKPAFKFQLNYPDVKSITSAELQDELESAFDRFGKENVLVVTRTNKRANQFNQQVRSRLLWMEEELSAGDYIMVVKNNYHWLKGESTAGFIANGDICEIKKIRRTEFEYGIKYADVHLRLVDYDTELEAKLFIDSLTSDGPVLPPEMSENLFEELKVVYSQETSRRAMYEKIRNDDHYNALQVKFAYAVTCHKSQGGQWPVVFIDQGYLSDDMINKEYYRWLYTAITRATEKAYLVNFGADFFPGE